MSCYHPLPAYVGREGGTPRIGYNAGGQSDKLELPCGRCIGCRLDRSRSWSLRIMHEAQLFDSNLFLTLDYAPEHLPASRSLEYVDFQRFMKRLRKEVSGVSAAPNGKKPIRFFCAGEYGETYGRPHWHAVLFNTDFADKCRYVNGTYRLAQAERLWNKGHVIIGDVTPQSAAYVAGYTLSKVYGSAADDHYEDVVNLSTGEVTRRRAEFCTMSRRPGIAHWWFEKFGRDVFPNDFSVSAEGKRSKVPRYYFEKYKNIADPLDVEDISHRRFLRAQEVDRHESSDARRAVREEVAWARVRTFSPRNH